MERPRITIHILSALDGKISGPFMALPSAQAAAREYAGLRAAYEADAWLYGATTTKEFTGHRRPVLGCGEHAAPPGDFVAESHADLYYVSVDTLGEIGWESGTFQPPGRPPAHVIEILTEQAPAAYRAYLQAVSYTHLDVYKRQRPGMSPSPNCAVAAPSCSIRSTI